MLKNLKILFSLLLILFLLSSISLATDIDMNLQPNNSITSSNNTLNEEIENANEITNNEIFENNTNDALYNPSTTVTSTSSVQDDALSTSNILNILLIVVGVVLILLGIAILIRMHS